MTRPEAERLARIETLLEGMPEMKADIKAIRKDLDADKADLAALKHRGTGILIGVALASGSFGAFVSQVWNAFK